IDKKRKVEEVMGAVIDVQFPPGHIPAIRNALKIEQPALIAEVAMQLEENVVRAVALASTDGLKRGAEVIDIGRPISVPVGPATLGRMFNVLGEPIDGGGAVEAKKPCPIPRNPPAFHEIVTRSEVFETGIKVIDLLAPYIRGGKIGLFGGAGGGKTGGIMELIHNIA